MYAFEQNKKGMEFFMKVFKYETNFKKNLFFSETHRRDESLPERFESNLINIYPDLLS